MSKGRSAGMTIYMSDILQTIVEKRRADIERLGLNFGIEIPEKRRVGHTEFLGNAGAILEVKRASPSKGDIAPDLDPVALATTYAEAHAQAVSVLTEGNFFKGTLRDLIAVADLMERRRKQGLHTCFARISCSTKTKSTLPTAAVPMPFS